MRLFGQVVAVGLFVLLAVFGVVSTMGLFAVFVYSIVHTHDGVLALVAAFAVFGAGTLVKLARDGAAWALNYEEPSA